MRRFLYSIGLLMCLLLASCSSSRMTLRTARSVSLKDPVITHLPTVVELEVDSVLQKADTTWLNIPFQNHVNKEAQQEVLIAEILEANNADVLVQPKINHDKDVTWTYTKHTLSVAGYPARYVNFHTATKEDIAILNGETDAKGKNPSIVNIYNGAPMSDKKSWKKNDQVMPIVPADNSLLNAANNAANTNPAKYMCMVEGGYMIGMHQGFSMSTTHGALAHGTKGSFFFGAGMGYYQFEDLNKMPIYSDNYQNSNSLMDNFVVYLDMRFQFGTSRWAPFVDIKEGMSVSFDAPEGEVLGNHLDLSVGIPMFTAKKFAMDVFAGFTCAPVADLETFLQYEYSGEYNPYAISFRTGVIIRLGGNLKHP